MGHTIYEWACMHRMKLTPSQSMQIAAHLWRFCKARGIQLTERRESYGGITRVYPDDVLDMHHHEFVKRSGSPQEARHATYGPTP